MKISSHQLNKTGFLPSCCCVNTTVWLLNIKPDVNYRRILHAVLNPIKQQLYGCLDPISQTIQFKRTRLVGTAREIRTNSYTTFFYRLIHMDALELADNGRLAHISPVCALNVVLKTYLKRWMIVTDGEKEPGNFLLSA